MRMGDDLTTASIKRTQEQLGKFVKKPPLTDKNLARPPFRFLHDIVHTVIETTGFMSGVFTPEELDAANVTSRDAKTAFMQKLIEAIKDKTGQDVPVKVSKILAGLDANKTNGLLQALAKSVEAHQVESGGGAPPKRKAAATSRRPGATATLSKSKAEASKADGNKAATTAKGSADKKDGGSGGIKRTIIYPSPTAAAGEGSGGKTAAKQGKTSDSPGPPSARRAPPRPKSSVVREEDEPYRPTTGKVAHVIMDNTEDADDDDNYVVREVTDTAASKPPGLSHLDETPKLGIIGGGVLAAGGQLDSIFPPDQRGLLVNQILETQKELEDKGKGGVETTMIEKKLKELSVAEIDKLKNLIQSCARSANPLAKLLDYMAEDANSMAKEYNAFKDESKRLNLQLENARKDTDKLLQNLHHDLNITEKKIKDKEDAILASQMKIIPQEERIEEIVQGFERVRSGKKSQVVKDHMPTVAEILSHIQCQPGSTSLSGGYGVGGGGGGPPSKFTFRDLWS